VVRAVSPDERVHLVAHDWGSIHAWPAVADPAHAEHFASFTSISGPDLEHIAGWLRTGLRSPKRLPSLLRQALHSWYLGAFQLPLIPELIWRLPPLRTRFHAAYATPATASSSTGRTCSPAPRALPACRRFPPCR